MWPRCRLPPSNALTQKPVHPQYETPRLKLGSLLSVVQDSEASADPHIVDVVDLWAPQQETRGVLLYQRPPGADDPPSDHLIRAATLLETLCCPEQYN